jgi:hypothetical protein
LDAYRDAIQISKGEIKAFLRLFNNLIKILQTGRGNWENLRVYHLKKNRNFAVWEDFLTLPGLICPASIIR